MLTKGLGLGGTERLLVDTVRLLDPSRYRVEVAYLLPWKDALVGATEQAGASVHCLDAPRPTSVTWLRRLQGLVKSRDIAIVHTHMPAPAAAARVVLRRRPVMVHTEHNVWDRYLPATRWANRLTYTRNRAVIAVSDAVAMSITSKVPVHVVRHGIDTSAAHHAYDSRAAARRELGIAPDEFVIGTVGNLTAKKDHATLLRATAEVSTTRPLRLVLIGSGPLETDTRALVARLGLADRVIMTGSRPDAAALLPAFDAFVLSSRFEGLPIALLEAMACGLPCVATSVGGIPEVITDGEEGTLVPAGDPAALATAIADVLGDPRRRDEMGCRAARRASDFDMRVAVRQIEHIYDAVLGR
jgi:glycosyltransferase involved in cell wall biosynthesis